MEGSAAESPGIGGPYRVALWHPPGVLPPARLMSALQARRIEAVASSSAFAALAEICSVSRAARSAGARASGSISLIIVHPEHLPEVGQVCRAAERYAPGVRCWMFGPETNPTLRAIVEEDVAGWTGEAALKVVIPKRQPDPEPKPIPIRPKPKVGGPDYRTKPVTPPQLRLAGAGSVDLPPEQADAEPAQSGEAKPRSQLLTPEELRMLLGDDEPGQATER